MAGAGSKAGIILHAIRYLHLVASFSAAESVYTRHTPKCEINAIAFCPLGTFEIWQ